MTPGSQNTHLQQEGNTEIAQMFYNFPFGEVMKIAKSSETVQHLNYAADLLKADSIVLLLSRTHFILLV